MVIEIKYKKDSNWPLLNDIPDLDLGNDTYIMVNDYIYKNERFYGHIIESNNDGSIDVLIDNGNMYMKGMIQKIYFTCSKQIIK